VKREGVRACPQQGTSKPFSNQKEQVR
jgi:hypothetical protein